MKKVLVITEQFPNSHVPYSGVFNLQMLQAIRDRCTARVISPVPWTVWLKYLFKKRFKSKIPEHGEWGGIHVYWPVLFHIPVLGRPLIGFLYFFSILGCALKLKRRFPFDIIYSISAFPDGFGSVILGKILKKPVVIRINGSDVNSSSKYYFQVGMVRWTLRNCSRIIAASKALKGKALELGVSENKIRVIYNGVDPQKFPFGGKIPGRQKKRVLFVGNLKKEKGLLELVAAFRHIGNEDRELVIIGEGPFFPNLIAAIEAHKLNHKVTLLGCLLHEQVSEWLRASDILCLPSYNEGLPNVVLEAYSSGTPVVGSDVGGIPELILSDDLGLLVPPKNIEALSDALDLALKKNWDREKIGNHAKQFTWERSVEHLIQEFELSLSGFKQNRVFIPWMKRRIKAILQKLLPLNLIIWEGRTREACVALSFDDGPHPVWTPKILDILKEFNVQATFFLIGNNVCKYPEIADRIVREGHEIGNHSNTHRNLSKISMSEIREELEAAQSSIAKCTGKRVWMVRPPKGILSLSFFTYILLNRFSIVMWSVDPEDFEAESSESIFLKTVKQVKGKGDIVLLHDKNQFTYEVLPRLLDFFAERGYRTVGVSRLIGSR